MEDGSSFMLLFPYKFSCVSSSFSWPIEEGTLSRVCLFIYNSSLNFYLLKMLAGSSLRPFTFSSVSCGQLMMLSGSDCSLGHFKIINDWR